MVEISNVKLPLDAGLPGEAGTRALRAAAARACGVSAAHVVQVRLLKRSVDARRKSDVHFAATLAVEFADAADEARVLVQGAAARGATVRPHAPYEPLSVPDCSRALACDSWVGARAVDGTDEAADADSRATAANGCMRPVVVGTGPAGLFCALYLARAGLRPIVLERGDRVERRVEAVDAFARGGAFDPESNIQFGEGGAGTFSDGKLTTNVKSPLAKHVVRWFVDAGAPEEIAWEAKPHIGTDKLRDVVRRMREEIERLGGEVRFRTRLVGVEFGADGRVSAVGAEHVPGDAGGACEPHAAGAAGAATERIACDRVVVACGHSARDTFEMLRDAGLAMERKPFSVGVRIEHDQRAIDRAQYGDAADHPALGAADYKLAVHLPNGRSAYTFCMCPGGEVVAAASEEGGVVVNGMSVFARDGRNANSALLVGVDPDDFGEEGGVLAGVEFQRRMERAAYRAASAAGGAPYAAPAQTVGDFLADRPLRNEKRGQSLFLVDDRAEAAVHPTYPRGVAWCDLRECLPGFVADTIAEALPLLDRKLHGFAAPEAVMTGVETRSSSPVRIVRGADLQAVRSSRDAADVDAEGRTIGGTGLYPCGEGAGYAGGIMSAAIDGLKIAARIAGEIAESFEDSDRAGGSRADGRTDG